MFTPARALTLLAAALFAFGCNGGTNPCPKLNAGDKDTDADGLPDCYELTLGTSPADVDSDGDGLSDFDEIVTKAFDPSINNFQFNPRIADVPRIAVSLQNVPDVSVTFTDSRSTSQTRSLTAGSRTSASATTTQTQEQTVSEEVSGTIGSEAGFPGFGISSSVTYSKSQQETLGWSQSQTRENERFRETTSSETSQAGVSNTGGALDVLVKVKNNGFQTITLSNLTLTALQVDPQEPTTQRALAGLDYDTTQGDFPSFDIGPNSESNALPFKGTLTLGKTYDFLSNSRNLSIEPTTWNITDQDGRSYTHSLTNVGARAARVVIDYAGAEGRAIESHYVATVTDFGKNRISTDVVLAEVLRLDFVEGDTGNGNQGLTRLRNVGNDASVNGRWLVLHNYLDTDGVTMIKARYDSAKGSYALEDIPLAKGETLVLMYLQDQDGDGLGTREEFLHGTSDTNPDTDGDGLSDFAEVKGGWEVPVTRGMTRTVYSDATVKDGDNDALEDGAERQKGTHPGLRDTDNDGVLDGADSPLTVADMQEVAFFPLEQGRMTDRELNGASTTSGTFGSMADRFGTLGAAVSIDADAEQLVLDKIFPAQPEHGASLVFWLKVAPELPANGYNLYEHAGSPTAIASGIADQFFWIYPAGFTVFGDGNDRHSIHAIQNSLFTSFAFADWHQVAIVASEETVGGGMETFTVYFDGEVYGQVRQRTPLLEFYLAPWTFAGPSSYAVPLSQYRGGLDDVRFFKRALDAEEVQLLFESPDPE